MIKLDIRDLTIGEYADFCDICGRWENECNDMLYDFALSENNEFIVCSDCLAEMEKLLSRLQSVQEHVKTA